MLVKARTFETTGTELQFFEFKYTKKLENYSFSPSMESGTWANEIPCKRLEYFPFTKRKINRLYSRFRRIVGSLNPTEDIDRNI